MNPTLYALNGKLLNAILTIAREEVIPRHNKDDYPTQDEIDTARSILRDAISTGEMQRKQFADAKRAAILHIDPCYCPMCDRTDCIQRNAYRRRKRSDGGLGLCPNL